MAPKIDKRNPNLASFSTLPIKYNVMTAHRPKMMDTNRKANAFIPKVIITTFNREKYGIAINERPSFSAHSIEYHSSPVIQKLFILKRASMINKIGGIKIWAFFDM